MMAHMRSALCCRRRCALLCLRVVLGRGAAASSGGGSFASAGGLRCQSVPAARGPVWFLGGGGFFQSFHPQKGLQHVTVTASVAHRLLSSFVPPSRCGSPWACWPGAGLPIPRRGRSFCLACQRAKSHVLVIGRLFAQPPRSPGLCWFLAVLGHLIHCPHRAAVGVTFKGVTPCTSSSHSRTAQPAVPVAAACILARLFSSSAPPAAQLRAPRRLSCPLGVRHLPARLRRGGSSSHLRRSATPPPGAWSPAARWVLARHPGRCARPRGHSRAACCPPPSALLRPRPLSRRGGRRSLVSPSTCAALARPGLYRCQCSNGLFVPLHFHPLPTLPASHRRPRGGPGAACAGAALLCALSVWRLVARLVRQWRAAAAYLLRRLWRVQRRARALGLWPAWRSAIHAGTRRALLALSLAAHWPAAAAPRPVGEEWRKRDLSIPDPVRHPPHTPPRTMAGSRRPVAAKP
jgi:hypothetical protein